MRLDADHELSRAAQELLRGAFLSDGGGPSLSEELLTRFALGALDELEKRVVVSALVKSPELRASVAQRRSELRAFASTPLSETARTAPPALFACVEESLTRLIGGCIGFRARCIEAGWEEMKSSWIARSALAATGAGIGNLRNWPGYAASRGGNDRFQVEGPILATIGVRGFAEILGDGRLIVRAEFEEKSSKARTSLEGKTLLLEWIDPAGGTIPLGRGTVQNLTWALEIPDFGSVCSLSAGSLPADQFRLSLDNTPPHARQRNHLFADVADESPIPLEIVDEPRLEGGHLLISLAAPQALLRQYADRRLELLVVVGQVPILLGAWPVSDWTNDSISFRIPIPGNEEGRIECGSVLLARIVRDC